MHPASSIDRLRASLRRHTTCLLVVSLVTAWPLSTPAAPPARQRPAAPVLPNRPNPEARYLLLVTHGWNSNAAAWANGMAAAMRNTIPPVDRAQWHCVGFDWAASAATARANAAMGNAIAIGGQLTASLIAPFPGGYDRIHGLGHSAGSHLVNAMVDAIADDRAIQLTFFDAYEPNGGNNSNLGRRASLAQNPHSFAEQYVDKREIVVVVDQSKTNETLRFACNHDITALDDRGLVGFTNHHAWPYVFYQRTVVNPVGADATAAGGWGFARAMALSFAVLPPSHVTDCGLGTRTVYVPPPQPLVAGAGDDVLFENPITLGSLQPSPTGSVESLSPTSVRLSTGASQAPVWFTIVASNTRWANTLGFDWEFTSRAAGGEGWLSACVDVGHDGAVTDSEVFFQADELYSDGGLHAPELVPMQMEFSYDVQTFSPGSRMISFRVDPMSTTQSDLVLSNVRWGLRGPQVSDAPGDVAAAGAVIRGVAPNPTWGPARIDYALARRGPLRLEIFDAAGKRVRMLLDRSAEAGAGSVTWDGQDSAGRVVPSGIYFVKLTGAGRTLHHKLVVMR